MSDTLIGTGSNTMGMHDIGAGQLICFPRFVPPWVEFVDLFLAKSTAHLHAALRRTVYGELEASNWVVSRIRSP